MEGEHHHHGLFHHKEQVSLAQTEVNPVMGQGGGVDPVSGGAAPPQVQHHPSKHDKHRKEEAELAGAAAVAYGLKEHHDKEKLEEEAGVEKKHHLF